MIENNICKCGHPQWMHHYPREQNGDWCAVCRCDKYRQDNLQYLEKVYNAKARV